MLRSLDNMYKRNGYFGVTKRMNKDGTETTEGPGDYKKATRVHDQWTRMREDKLRSLKKTLRYSYQAAIVQKYDVSANSDARWLISLATKIEKYATLTIAERAALTDELAAAAQKYPELEGVDPTSQESIAIFQNLADRQVSASPYFRCLINHDKLKGDYEDKVLSIPYR